MKVQHVFRMNFRWNRLVTPFVFLYVLIISFPCIAFGKEIEIRGLIENSSLAYFETMNDSSPDFKNSIRFTPKLNFTPTDKFCGMASFEIEKLFWVQNDVDIQLGETYADLYFDIVDFRIGNQYIVWGKVDGQKPLSVFQRQDLRDPFEERDLPVWGIKGDLYINNLTIEAVCLPIFQETVLPNDTDARWLNLPMSTLIPNVGEVKLEYEIDNNGGKPSSSLKSFQGGIRFTGSYSYFDFGIMAARAYDLLPSYLSSSMISMDPVERVAKMRLQPEYHRNIVGGIDFSAAIKQLCIRGEMAYYLTEDSQGEKPEVDDPFLLGVLSLDYRLSQFFRNWELSIILQGAIDQEIPLKGSPNQEESNSLRHLYEYACRLNVELKFSEYTKLSVRGLVDTKNHGFFIQPKLSWSIVDGVVLNLSSTFIEGGNGGTRDMFNRYKNFDYLRLSFDVYY